MHSVEQYNEQQVRLETLNQAIQDAQKEEPAHATKSKKIACVECRQQKAKCDANEKYPDPCSRCSKKNISCTLNSGFKRTYKRAKIAEMQREYEAFKRHMIEPDRPLPINVDPYIAPPTLSYEPKGFTKIPQEVMQCTPKHLGDLTLSSTDIGKLFHEFVENYHPVLPVVDVQKGPERIYRLCPVLFWTICFVALRRSSESELYMVLSPLLKSLLAEVSISPITRYAPTEVDEPILNASSVYSVQAFLLYTFWPPLTSSLSADTSWNTIGVAVFQAIRIGLHTSGRNLENVNELASEQVRTWIGCNVVSQYVATAFGFPSFAQFDASVLLACRNDREDVPVELKQMLEIERMQDRVAKSLNSNHMDPLGLVDAPERIPLLKILSHEMDELEIRVASDSSLDDVRRLTLLTSRLHTLTYYFLDGGKVADFELQRGIVKVFNAALAVISHCRKSQNLNPKFVTHLPGVYVLNIWQAASIIARLVHSPYAAALDLGAGKELFQEAMKLTMKASVMKHDMAYRSSGILRNMWAIFKVIQDRNQFKGIDITIRTRMSASVFFDCLWILREKCGMIKLVPGKPNRVELSESDSEEYISSRKVEPVAKKRRLSETHHPESSARKIINTIPLDPQPMTDLSKPFSRTPGSDKLTPAKDETLSIDSAENSRGWDSDVLWRDIDSVMTDFGFHTEELPKSFGV